MTADTDDTTDDQIDAPSDLATITDDGIEFTETHYKDSNLELKFDDVHDRATPYLDWFKGRPAFYFFSSDEEECQLIVMLETEDEPLEFYRP